MENPFLNPDLGSENPIQKINKDAAHIEAIENLRVVRCHLGDPLGPQDEATNQAMAEYYSNRGKERASRGYIRNVAGQDDARREIANAVNILNRLDGAGAITGDHVVGVTGGTGALNVAMKAFKNPVMLAPDPFYPPWTNIAQMTGTTLEHYPTRAEDEYLLNYELLAKRLEKASQDHPGRPLVLMYHYPNNPTGKTLDEGEARQVADTLNRLTAKYPSLHLLQEDLYVGTVAPEMGLYTPLPYLNDEARARTMWLGSPSKLGHAQDRGAFVCAYDPAIIDKIRSAVSIGMLGASTPAMIATAKTMNHIAQGGLDAIDALGSDPKNFRFALAKYYQERLKIVSQGLQRIEQFTGATILDSIKSNGADTKTPKGSYYLFPNFEFLRGKPVPQNLREVVGSDTFENSAHLTRALLHAHKIGLRPVSVAPGSMFTNAKDTLRIRIATVVENKNMLLDAVNTLYGLVEKTLDVKLGAEYSSVPQLRERERNYVDMDGLPPTNAHSFSDKLSVAPGANQR